ncbi:MAG: 16S rRNA (cytidine(1402)-2'-O)-methyltransferase [Pseudomonadota bacterium]
MTRWGTLFIVATPLGNLEDLTYRAARVLSEVELVAAEDTRRTRKLMAHLGLRTKLVSYREQNHHKILPQVIEVLARGGQVALVTDAGTPGISDPGVWLVVEAARNGAAVAPIPGPSAVIAALSAAGLPAGSFLFAGYPPVRKKARLAFFEELSAQPRTLVFFEAPHRLAESLSDAALVLGDRPAALCREMTKINEEILRGRLMDLAEEIHRRQPALKGEITLVVAGREGAVEKRLSAEELAGLIKGDHRPVREIVAELADCAALSRSELYRLVLRLTGRTS